MTILLMIKHYPINQMTITILTLITSHTHELAVLHILIDPLDECNDMEVGFYAAVKQFIEFCQNHNT